ncbi:alpha/beta hydrolase fold protein [Catenulispora acidiphila DSM 44928]|uniref:Alpha/beta hydrolase fold protein n=1 Tax=Catenulispora acidiphila (strain DSM 44928 / JCM 14897 / NBRC 102108 / NRRL B-24433 / ID139908) TaxID=479433 RepID=C7QE57_CATAD|nr:alpha/beta hydrolase [Catenulispora acidiphila]ACU76645.1 alpha/beta hydrolase fold protein [Catenulispora acidiphila DSM 44928]
MSTPPFVDLPPFTVAVQLPTAGGPLAALRATPPAGVTRLGAAVLVPGFTGSKEDFIAVMTPLAEAGYEVVSLDQRGQNESAGPEDPSAYTLPQLAADLADVIDGLTDDTSASVHIMGHSFGGLVAREYALSHVGRVRSLALLDSGPAAIPGRSAEQATLLVAAAGFMTSAEIWAEMQKISVAEGAPQHRDPAVRAFLQQRFENNGTAMLAGMGTSILSAVDRTAELAAAGLPLLVAAGVGDDAWPVQLQKEMATQLGTDLVLIEDAAHSPAAENPPATAQLLVDFWARNG